MYAFMRHALASDTGAELYKLRKQHIEPAFGQIKHHRGINRSDDEAERLSARNGG